MYYKAPYIKEKPTTYDLKEVAERFIEADNLKSLAGLLKIDLPLLKAIAFKPRYRQFYIPKPDGKKRLIETPVKSLKDIQKKLSYNLQAVYIGTGIIPPCSYGFILSTEDEDHTRDIYTNAKRHVGKKWVYGLDLKDFFHCIRINRVEHVLRQGPFHFTKNASRCLAQLVTFKGRLPMGASTSPVISNLVCVPLDRQLSALAESEGWTYTRFADDMTFSSDTRFDESATQKIKEIIKKHGFPINHKKERQHHEKEQPEITGLILVNGQPDISDNYIKRLKKDIDLFHALTSDHIIEKGIFPSKTMQLFRRSLLGQINFVGFVRGDDHKSFLKLRNRLSPKNR